jgi:hypothetical protein
MAGENRFSVLNASKTRPFAVAAFVGEPRTETVGRNAHISESSKE